MKLNLFSALNYISNTVLTTANGWRNQSTFVIFVTFNQK